MLKSVTQKEFAVNSGHNKHSPVGAFSLNIILTQKRKINYETKNWK